MDKSKRSKGDTDDPAYALVDKTKVLQDAKECFRAVSGKTSKLVDVLTKCIYLMLKGEKLTNTEATDLFLHITFLFQYKSKDNTLRRLIYIAIKALSHQADQLFAVTASLTADVTNSGHDPSVRASALRALCQIADASTFESIERFLRQSIVDKHPVVASAALTSLIHIAKHNSEIVKRCTNEIQEALKSDSPMVQYHALALRYMSCKNDRLATSRLLKMCIDQRPNSPLAICLLLRILANYINDSPTNDDVKLYIRYISDCLSNHRSEMVEYEAANTMVAITKDPKILEKHKTVVNHLRNFLAASKPALRYAAVKSLNALAQVAPDQVRQCNLELETLISQSDCNRSIAILAITTLLETGTEGSVDKFLKQIGEFLSEIDDGFKVVVVGSVRQLCQKYPAKHPVVMDFLSNMLREEGGYDYKKAIVDTIIKIIEDNEDAKEKGLEQLCEFIEDCEHNSLAIEVLNLLGREGPKSRKASTYVRFIANRLLLDATPVACAATTALAKFGVVPELSESIKTALERFSLHEDYDVMERAVFYKNILSIDDPVLNGKFITNTKPQISFSDLESKLMSYLEGDCEQPFDISSVGAAPKEITLQPIDELLEDTKPKVDVGPPLESVFEGVEHLRTNPLGPLVTTAKLSPLTDSVLEVCVHPTLHIYERHIILQFDCTNTVEDWLLEGLGIELTAPRGFNFIASTEYPKLEPQETAPIYVCYWLTERDCLEMNYFTRIKLRYNLSIISNDGTENEDTGENEFPLVDLFINLADHTTEDHLQILESLDQPEN